MKQEHAEMWSGFEDNEVVPSPMPDVFSTANIVNAVEHVNLSVPYFPA